MATPPEQPWSNYEKNSLLAEIIKVANPPPQVLLNVIQSSQLQLRWEDTILPPGRSLNSCRYAFEELRRSIAMPMGTPLGPLTPVPMGGPSAALKRPFPYEATYGSGPSGREIRPKPPAPSSAHTLHSPTDPPAKKKRGRPTKAEALAKLEAAAATGATHGEPSPISSAPRGPLQTTPQPAPAPPPTTMGVAAPRAGEPRPGPVSTPAPALALAPAPSSVTRMPIAAMLAPSAREPQSGGHNPPSEPSSGRRRRAKSTKSEPGDSPSQQSAGVVGPRYESPYAAARPPPGSDSPARAAVLRHRHEPPTSAPPSQALHEPAHETPETTRSHEPEHF